LGEKMIWCPIHEWQTIDYHHIKPKFYGGAEDGPKQPICHECHVDLHRKHDDMHRAGWLGLVKHLEEEGISPSEHMGQLGSKSKQIEREALGDDEYRALQSERAKSRWRKPTEDG
jgi:hypothetical protein